MSNLPFSGPFTVFGPTDAAFSKLPKEILDRLAKDKTLLADVLMYHVVSGKVYSSQLSNEQLAPSLLKVEGQDVNIRINIYNSGKVIKPCHVTFCLLGVCRQRRPISDKTISTTFPPLLVYLLPIPVSILRKSISGRHRLVRVADGLMTARCRFT